MKITAIVGSYRKGGIIDQATDAILESAREAGAETSKIHLIDKHIEFCANCRECTQQPGKSRGVCVIPDEMSAVLDEIETSDALILASPMNFGTVTAVMKRFIERLVCYAYWPWGAYAPKIRRRQKDKRAVLVASSAAPAIIARPTSRIVSLLKSTADTLGAKAIGTLFIGLAAREQKQQISESTRKKAHALGKKLVQG